MTESREINITSVNLVKDELVAAVDSAAALLDQFAAEEGNRESLGSCIAGLRQVCGVLQMVQLKSGELLAQEMLRALTDMETGKTQPSGEVMEALSTSFYVITRYLEFVQNRGVARPELLIPYINHLRATLSEPPVPESHFFSCRLDASVPGAVSSAVMSEDLRSFVRRFRHMYQVGLLALLQGKPSQPAYTMMARALQRVASVTAGRPIGKLWAVAGSALAGMAASNMHISRSRVMVFSMFDRRLRALQREGDKALDQSPPAVLMKESLYWLALSRPRGQGARILETFNVAPLGYGETELERERASLGGPGATAITAVAVALDEELSGVRRMLDDVETLGVSGLCEDEGLMANLGKIASILLLLNFHKVGTELGKAVDALRSEAQLGGTATETALQNLTQQVLQVDNTIRALRQSSSIDVDEFGHADSAVEMSQLAEAEVTVLKEAEAGLSLIKRALASYAESGYDYGHIRNVSTTLNSVRGGLVVLNLTRAAGVVERLVDFVETVMQQREAVPEIEQALDTFADAIISLEYYLGEVRMHRKANPDSLKLALESLAVLGYPVEAA
ncbi:hypothetical protein [Microbulbifer yueqingensis]|uniref:Scaffold protein FimL second domain-containing protein n=1 Tax=Microbulbifer yueqingensis TaxID=658219 RepID=A0A1G9AFG5_9GAMM|nr:hypothetical protein [Microbulbifer yueqingensis]SDK26107.1 hypothetical protein SAMN05216212_1994 [Microbulbifer yueqingensis]